MAEPTLPKIIDTEARAVLESLVETGLVEPRGGRKGRSISVQRQPCPQPLIPLSSIARRCRLDSSPLSQVIEVGDLSR
jgi:hypothetical protein